MIDARMDAGVHFSNGLTDADRSDNWAWFKRRIQQQLQFIRNDRPKGDTS
jgi:hypothetical protein